MPDSLDYPININIVKRACRFADDPADADFALAAIWSPNTESGYDVSNVKKRGTGYVPIIIWL